MKNFQIQNFNDYQKLLDALLRPNSKEKDQKRIPFITTYNKTLPNVKQIINKR